ncbi:hypothetical protein EPA93_07210 [Ktedonosporobacter rubrisoli]|uniref:Uncharacterized protein n=1 Tax=Ktedonosporobacter rubrisoli TaxID=2509675 RepID=A0A4P6JMB4_KTERU|nr:hypothetical protein [Ktedonosporobacter rubrisoli]QBD75806.1 hypothetical protein EPA93_07210 [Ktedonosporobacter rubrisoli]
MKDEPLENILRELHFCQREWKQYEDELVKRAQRQAIFEDLYNDVQPLLKHCIELMSTLREGEVVSREWCVRRDACLKQLKEYTI